MAAAISLLDRSPFSRIGDASSFSFSISASAEVAKEDNSVTKLSFNSCCSLWSRSRSSLSLMLASTLSFACCIAFSASSVILDCCSPHLGPSVAKACFSSPVSASMSSSLAYHMRWMTLRTWMEAACSLLHCSSCNRLRSCSSLRLRSSSARLRSSSMRLWRRASSSCCRRLACSASICCRLASASACCLRRRSSSCLCHCQSASF
mmetsp:Transcript_148469/g.258979  ORF Transcript_148469/g.258979 Transcript_148469/m.258979 type:complete len:206 (+) Transcript_148469:1487-2104(+)